MLNVFRIFITMSLLSVIVHIRADDSAKAEGSTPSPICETVNKLLQSHSKGFTEFRGSHSNTRYADIWRATFDAIGKECEIWRSGNVKTHYICTRSAPNKEIADDYYNTARSVLRSCLGTSWSETEAPRKLGNGVKATFSAAETKPVIELHEIKVEGVFKDQWTIYYIVGEPTEKL